MPPAVRRSHPAMLASGGLVFHDGAVNFLTTERSVPRGLGDYFALLVLRFSFSAGAVSDKVHHFSLVRMYRLTTLLLPCHPHDSGGTHLLQHLASPPALAPRFCLPRLSTRLFRLFLRWRTPALRHASQDPTKRPPFQDIVEDLEAEIEAAESGTDL